MPARLVPLLGVALSACTSAVRAQEQVPRQGERRTELTPSDTAARPENITSSRDGTVYFGSMASGTIYRAAPGAASAEPWILASTAGLANVLGVLADDRSNTLWVCQNVAGRRGGAPVAGQTALRSFNLTRGAATGSYPFPADAGFCNDIAVAADGAVYASESYRGRVHRLRPGAAALEVWASDSAINVIDGNRAEVRVLRDGLPRASGVTLVGDSALVLIDFAKAVVVPYRPR